MDKIEERLASAIEKFDSMYADPTASFEKLMDAIGEIRILGAAWGRQIEKKEVMLTEEGCDYNIKKLQEQLNRIDAIAMELFGEAIKASAGFAGKGQKLGRFSATVGGAALSGTSRVFSGRIASEQQGYQSRSGMLTGRAAQGRQGDQGKVNEQSQAISAEQQRRKENSDAKTRIS